MRDRNPPKKPKGAPEQARPRTRTTARHRHVPPRRNRPAPCRAPRPKSSRDRTGRTRDVEFIEGIDKCRGGDPDGLFASSLATSTTARARPESWVSGRASTVPSPASLSARRNPVVAFSPRTERLAHHLLDHAGPGGLPLGAHCPDEAPLGLLSRARERAPQDRAPRARERREQPHTRGSRTEPRPARARRRKLLPLPPARRPQQPELVARRLDQGRFSVFDCSTRPRPRACATVFPTQLAQNTAASKRPGGDHRKRRRHEHQVSYLPGASKPTTVVGCFVVGSWSGVRRRRFFLTPA